MKKKVLMVIPNLGFGGAQRVFHDLSNCLSQQFDVVECVFNFDDGHAYPTKNKTISLDVPAGKNVVAKAFYFLMRIRRLRKLKSQLQINYSISHLEGADYINILSAHQEKTLLYIHGSKRYDSGISGGIGWLRKKVLLPMLYNQAHKIVTVSEGIRNELVTHFKISQEKVTVINNSLDTNNIRTKSNEEIPSQYRALFKKPVIITHGRLALEKDHRFLIKLFSSFPLKETVNLVFIGNGPLLDDLIDYSKALGLRTYNAFDQKLSMDGDHQVFFLGFHSNPFALLKKASLFVFPSHFEGFPMALLEGMRCGLPVIARNCPYGPNEIINPGNLSFETHLFAENGVLVSNKLREEQDIKLWQEAITRLLKDSAMLSNYRKQSIVRSRNFDSKYFCEAWINILS